MWQITIEAGGYGVRMDVDAEQFETRHAATSEAWNMAREHLSDRQMKIAEITIVNRIGN